MGSIFEYANRNPIFGVVKPDSFLWAPILLFFAITGFPSAGAPFWLMIVLKRPFLSLLRKLLMFPHILPQSRSSHGTQYFQHLSMLLQVICSLRLSTQQTKMQRGRIRLTATEALSTSECEVTGSPEVLRGLDGS